MTDINEIMHCLTNLQRNEHIAYKTTLQPEKAWPISVLIRNVP